MEAAHRIEISGGIGAGKTTLARTLAALRPCRLVEEEVRTVPFFRQFYAEPMAYGFHKNVSFVLSHADRARSEGGAAVVCDYALFQDLAYTDIVCEAADVRAVEAVLARMVARIGHPALLVHLACAPEIQLTHIARRGRPEEGGLGLPYLERLRTALDRRLAAFRRESPATRVLTIDADALDLEADPDALRDAATRIWAALDEGRA
ncbi:MAG TPA: deoxynucleoside kinase [Salinarimonas sp.]|jgi:deoxyadenosine/deoxycytidine kinase|nr:deoxynucleoside kinase [Salinarimonas sp.]